MYNKLIMFAGTNSSADLVNDLSEEKSSRQSHLVKRDTSLYSNTPRQSYFLTSKEIRVKDISNVLKVKSRDSYRIFLDEFKVKYGFFTDTIDGHKSLFIFVPCISLCNCVMFYWSSFWFVLFPFSLMKYEIDISQTLISSIHMTVGGRKNSNNCIETNSYNVC